MISGFAEGPEGTAAAPGIEPDTGAAGERRGQRSLRHRDEAEAHPDAVEPLRPREDGGDVEGRRMVEGRRDELHGGEVEQRAGRRGVGQGPITDALPDPRERRRGDGGRRRAPGLWRRRVEVRCRTAGSTSCQAPRPSRSWRGGTCTRAWPGS